MEDLRLGATILREHISLETEKAERAARVKASEKANAAAAAEKVYLRQCSKKQGLIWLLRSN
jgi:hypothetical protein